jgi:hypothetical protein
MQKEESHFALPQRTGASPDVVSTVSRAASPLRISKPVEGWRHGPFNTLAVSALPAAMGRDERETALLSKLVHMIDKGSKNRLRPLMTPRHAMPEELATPQDVGFSALQMTPGRASLSRNVMSREIPGSVTMTPASPLKSIKKKDFNQFSILRGLDKQLRKRS